MQNHSVEEFLEKLSTREIIEVIKDGASKYHLSVLSAAKRVLLGRNCNSLKVFCKIKKHR